MKPDECLPDIKSSYIHLQGNEGKEEPVEQQGSEDASKAALDAKCW